MRSEIGHAQHDSGRMVGNPEITNSSGQLVNIAISLIKPLPGGLSSQHSQNKSR